MTRDNAKELINLLTIVANSPRNQELLVKEELERSDITYINSIKNVLDSLSKDLDNLVDDKLSRIGV